MLAHPADRLNVMRAILAPAAVFYPFAFGFPGGHAVIYIILLFALVGDTNYILHLHIHRPFLKNRVLNLILDICMGLSTGMMASNWRIQHLYGHHLGHDYAFRYEDGWELQQYSPAGAILFSLRSMFPTFAGPIAEAFNRGVRKNDTSPISYRWAFVDQAILLAVFGFLAIANWRLAVQYLLPWYFVTYFISRYVDYLNHYGCNNDTRDVYSSSNNSLSRSFNMTTHNFGYHTAHHLRPGAHWTELPEIHERIKEKIPASCLKHVSWSFLLFPYHLLRGARGKM